MTERNVIGSITSASLAPLFVFYDKMLPWLLFAAVLIVVDCRFGVAAARKRGENIRSSRKWRRSLNKMVDYICWVTLAGLCGNSIGEVLGMPVVSVGILLIVYGIEISSCLNNYFEYKGIRKKINIFKLFNRPEIADALEDVDDENNDKEQR